MLRSARLRKQAAEARTAMRALADAADKNDDGLMTAEQQAQYDAHKAKAAAFDAQAAEAEQLEAAERAAPAVRSVDGNGNVVAQVRDRAEGDPAHGFRSHVEFFSAVIEAGGSRSREQVREERLRPLAVLPDKDDRSSAGELAFAVPSAFAPRGPRAAVGSDEQGGYSDTYGGFSVVAARGAPRPGIGFEGDPTEGRCESIPMTAPVVEMEAATDKDHTTSVAAGLTVTRRPETKEMVASRMGLEMISLKASGAYGLSFATEEILQDSPISWLSRVSNGFDRAFAAFKLQEKLRGKGGAERLGVLTALAGASLGPTISIAKESGQAADTINYQNVIKARSRCWGYGSAIWLANHDCYPQLAVLAIPVGVAGQLVYQQSLVEDRPDMLLGRPIFYTEYASTIGDQGDLILGNWSQYMEGEYQPVTFAESMHVRFLNAERALRFMKRDCGAPSWKVPLTPNKSANTLSPFVVLDAR